MYRISTPITNISEHDTDSNQIFFQMHFQVEKHWYFIG
jgi:hypothetical protein